MSGQRWWHVPIDGTSRPSQICLVELGDVASWVGRESSGRHGVWTLARIQTAGLLHRTWVTHGVSREFGAQMMANDHEDVEYGQSIDGKALESALGTMSPTLPVSECLELT